MNQLPIETERTSEVIKLHREMRPLILKSGVGEKRYDKLIIALEVRSDSYYIDLFQAINRIYDGAYKKALAAYRPMHMKEETWEAYELLGITGLAEQEILKKALKHLAEAVREILFTVKEKKGKKS